MSITNQKLIKRNKYLSLRAEIIKNERYLILNQVIKLIKGMVSKGELNSTNHIGIYWPLNGEIDLRSLKQLFNNPFALPCCNKKGNLEYRHWSIDPLRKDSCGIPSPLKGSLLNPDEIGVIFVPAVAIDRNGIRLGYGGGFFDRLRKSNSWKSVQSYVVLPKACVSETPLPFHKWDIPFKAWITEYGEERIKKRS
tara:strand:+ start:67893 stop:68477 length:585 start_codon:yes stop_codon:yes gene_type:complete